MSDDQNAFGKATVLADEATREEPTREEPTKEKPQRGVAHIIRRASSNSPDEEATREAPIEARPKRKSLVHVIRRASSLPVEESLPMQDSMSLLEDSGEVLLTPPNALGPNISHSSVSPALGKGGSGQFSSLTTTADELTVEEGQPQPPEALLAIADQASLSIAPPHDLDRGFLDITSGNDKGRRVGLPEGRTTIGRGIDCDIVLTDIAVSRRHMYVERRDNVYFLCDLSSGNGTYVNDKERRGEVVIVNGDTFRIGTTVLSFEGPEARDGEERTTNWQPPGGNQHVDPPIVLRQEPEQLVEEPGNSTVDGRGWARRTSQAADEEQENGPPTELPTNIVASVEIASDVVGPSPKERPRASTMPPPVPRKEDRDIEDAALAAVSSIIATPLPEPPSFDAGALPSLIVPPTPSPVIPYPVPGQQPAPPPRLDLRAGPSPRPPRPTVGYMGIAPQDSRPYPTPQGGSQHSGSQHSGSQHSVSQHSGSQHSNSMMSRPMLPGASGDFHNHYPPTSHPARSSAARSAPERTYLLMGVIGVALVLVVVGIVAAVVGPDEKETLAAATSVSDPNTASVGTSPETLPQKTAETLPQKTTETLPEKTAETLPQKTAETIPQKTTETLPQKTAETIPQKTSVATNNSSDDAPKPILVASLIAGNTQLPASTWGTNESFPTEVVDATPDPDPIPPAASSQQNTAPPTPPVAEPAVIADARTLRPTVEPIPDLEPRPPEPRKLKPATKPAIQKQRKPKPQPRKPKTRQFEEEEPEEDLDEERDTGPQMDVASVRSAARTLYIRREFDKAARTLTRAADRIDDDRDAMRLADIADAYRKIGSSLSKAEREEDSNPGSALNLYKKALSQDKKFASGVLSKLIRLRMGHVAPRAAKSYMSQGKYAQAKKAADTAARYDERDAVQSVYDSLERKAISLIKNALRAKRDGDDEDAKDMLREATKIAPKGTAAYDKCRQELRKF